MSKVCEICGRGPLTTQSKSHSQVKTKVRKYPNLQAKRIDGKKIKICTRCLRTKVKVKKS